MNQRTILIVDDDADIRESLRDSFEDEGYCAQCARNGVEALKILRGESAPSAVVLDLIMPFMSGNEVYAAMKADPKLADIPVLVSTSDPSSAPSGVLLLRKPINLATMLAVVNRLAPS